MSSSSDNNTPSKLPNILQWGNSKTGEFVRKDSAFRDTLSTNPNDRFYAEPGRYHLYVSYACPWAHRTLMVRALKGLEDIIGLSVVDYYMGEKGWKFSTAEETPGCIPDPLYQAQYIRELYFKANSNYDGRFTVPVLWDTKHETIVNNESSEIIRMFNSAFDSHLPKKLQGVSYYPEKLRAEIDEVNGWIYDTINNGVYKAGFATQQEAYAKNAQGVFASLDRVEDMLSDHRSYLVGGDLTEVDIRLFTTIVRFDPVYHGHFKCNLRSIGADYPHLLRWLRRIYQLPHVKDTVNMEHIKGHYYKSHRQINPYGIVPIGNGPDLDVKIE